MEELRESLNEAIAADKRAHSSRREKRVADRARDVQNAERAKELPIKGVIPKKYLQVE